MADYYALATKDIKDPDSIGFAHGETPTGEHRVLFSFPGPRIHPELSAEYQQEDWFALSPEVALQLLQCLDTIRDQIDTPENSLRILRAEKSIHSGEVVGWYDEVTDEELAVVRKRRLEHLKAWLDKQR